MSPTATFSGVREAVVDEPAVKVQVSQGEYLLHSLFAENPEPSFTFGCAHDNVLREASRFEGHPRETYQWIYPESPADVAGHDSHDVYGVMLLFLGGNAYRYLLEHYDAAGVLLSTVRDVRLSSTNPQDMWSERVSVFFA